MALNNTENYIIRYLSERGDLPVSSACGILANMRAESNVIPYRIQGDFSSGYSNSKSYTTRVDSGSISDYAFTNQGPGGGGYGLCQWTYYTRKQGLLNLARSRKVSIGDLDMQLDYLRSESEYRSIESSLKNQPNTSAGAASAAEIFVNKFEKPLYNTVAERRQSAISIFSQYSPGAVTLSPALGNQIVTIALAQVGKSYAYGGNGESGSFDNAGLIYYCFNQASYEIADMTANGYYDYFVNKGSKSVGTSNTAAGDLLFWSATGSSNLYRIAIADGQGGFIEASEYDRSVIHKTSLDNPTYVIRVFTNSNTVDYVTSDEGLGGSTGSGSSSETYVSSEEYAELTSIDPYSQIIENNLSRVTAVGYDYGYLIDMDHGGVFKFYIPEFSETAGANWKSIDIRGRSVQVQAYETTSSRVISVALDLYAGMGLYKSKSSGESAGLDSVSKLHEDLYFVKSLEYPDYTQAIIRPPSTVHLILGSALNISGVVSAVSVQHLKPFDKYNRSMYVKLSFTVTQTEVNPPDYSDIRKGSTRIKASEDPSSISSTPSAVIPNIS